MTASASAISGAAHCTCEDVGIVGFCEGEENTLRFARAAAARLSDYPCTCGAGLRPTGPSSPSQKHPLPGVVTCRASGKTHRPTWDREGGAEGGEIPFASLGPPLRGYPTIPAPAVQVCGPWPLPSRALPIPFLANAWRRSQARSAARQGSKARSSIASLAPVSFADGGQRGRGTRS